MARQPHKTSGGVRFLHAAHLMLDVAIRGVGPVAGPARRILEDASLLALDRLVEVAIDRGVDAVVLGGNSFRIADRSLRARLRIEQGLATLSEAGIATVANCGPLDPPAAWYDLALPEDVSILTAREPVATVQTEHGPLVVSRGDAGRDEVGFRAVLIPADDDPSKAQSIDADYIGLATGVASTSDTDRGTVLDPGSLCPLNPSHVGLQGAALVEDSRAGVRTTMLDLSPLHCSIETIEIDGQTDIEQLAESMQERLGQLAPLSDERPEAAVITWQLSGSGPVQGDLALDGTWDDLIELIDEAGGRRIHLFRREPVISQPDEVAAMLTDELDGYFEQTDLAIDDVIESINHSSLRQRIDAAGLRERIEPRVRELTLAAVSPNCPSLWDSDAA